MSVAMAKTETVRARINPETKAMAEKVLSEYGMSHSTFINLSYHSLINGGGIPVSRNIPNDELAASLRASRDGTEQSTQYKDVDSMMRDLWTD